MDAFQHIIIYILSLAHVLEDCPKKNCGNQEEDKKYPQHKDIAFFLRIFLPFSGLLNLLQRHQDNFLRLKNGIFLVFNLKIIVLLFFFCFRLKKRIRKLNI